MGLFGPKKSAEQKAYEKVYEKFPSKKVSISDLESALKAWERADGPQTDAWKAYFLIALAYDCGAAVPVNEEAAKPYHEKAKSLMQGSGDQKLKKWCHDFYYWYNQCAINHYRKLDQQTLNVRRLGNAAMNVAGNSRDGRMLSEIKRIMDYLYFQDKGTATDTAGAFWYYLSACRTDRDGNLVDCNDPKYANDSVKIKDVQAFEKRALKEYKQIQKVYDEKIKYADMDSDYHNYIYGFQFFNSSPLCAMYAFDNIGNPVTYGLERVFRAAYVGNSMAIHKLVLLAKADAESHAIVETAFSSKYRSLDAFLLNSLEKCERAGDYTAKDLIARYFTEHTE